MYSKKLAVCAIFENAARLLPEWLAYHHLVGVEHFVLYDNGSTDQSAQAIHDSPVALQTTLIRWPQKPGRLAAYRHFIDIFAPGFDWVAFIDVDQFLLPLGSRSVTDTLEWLNTASAILVHRRVFAPDDWPAGTLAIEAFRRRAADGFPAHRHARTIARCAELLDVGQQPHEFRLNGPAYSSAGHVVQNQAIQEQPSFQNLVIHQYCTQAGPDALARLLDPSQDIPSSAGEQLRAALAEQEDDGMRDLAPAVRHLLGLPLRPSAAEPGASAGEPAAPAAVPGLPDALIGMPAAGETPVPSGPAAPPDPFVATAPSIPAGSPIPADSPIPAGSPISAGPSIAAGPLIPTDPFRPNEPAIQLQPMVPPNSSGATPIEPPPQVWMQPPVHPVTRHPAESSNAFGQPPIAAGWTAVAPEGQERTGGLALVFRDRSRPGEIWLAALRGAAADGTDPAFLTDAFERIRDFPSDAAARDACDAALARGHRP